MSLAAVSSKAIILSLITHCLLLLPLCIRLLCWVHVVLCQSCCPVEFSNHHAEVESVGNFVLIELLLLIGYLWSLPRNGVGCVLVSDCGISWTYLIVCTQCRK